MTTLTIHTVATGTDLPTAPAGTVTLYIERRKVSKHHLVFVPTSYWPITIDVPAIYRPLVDAALIAAGEAILKRHLETVGMSPDHFPLSAITTDKLLASDAATGRMTGDRLLGMFRQTNKYIFDVTGQLTSRTGSALLKYKAALERIETTIKALPTKAGEKLSAVQLDAIMAAVKIEDADSPYAIYVATRTEELREALADQADSI